MASIVAPMRQAVLSDSDFSTGGIPPNARISLIQSPTVHRLALTDEIRPTADRRTSLQRIGGQKMSRRRVFDVNHVNEIRSVADSPKPATSRTIEQPGNQMLVTRPPDQVRPQRAREQPIAIVRFQDMLLAQRFRMRIMAKPATGVRRRLVDAILIGSVEGHAGAARIDQPRDLMLQTPSNDVMRTECVDAIEMIPRAPDPGDTGAVKDDVDAFASPGNGIWIAQVTGNRLDA